MNFKNIILIILILPMISYSKNLEVRIKELKKSHLQKELELSSLSEMITKKYESRAIYKANALSLLTVLHPEKKNSHAEESLNQLMKDFNTQFDNAKDVKDLFEGSVTSVEENSYEALRVTLLIMLIEERLIGDLISKYETDLDQLIKCNIELKNLI